MSLRFLVSVLAVELFSVEVRAADRVHIWIQAYIPNMVGRNDAFVQTPTRPAIKAPVGGSCYSIDATNSGQSPTDSARLTTEFDAVITGRSLSIEPHAGREINRVGETHKLDCVTGNIIATDRASSSTMTIGPVRESRMARAVALQASVANPFLLVSVPTIDYSLSIRYDVLARTIELRGIHDGFPAYTGWYSVNGRAAVQFVKYMPTDRGPGSLMDFWSGLNSYNISTDIRLH